MMLRKLGSLGLAAGLAACASLEEKVQDTEQLLAAAGFKINYAQTAEQQANVKGMTQYKLVAHPKGDKVMYIYADANICQCIYVGDADAYARFQKLAVEKEIADEQRQAAETNLDATMNWGMWGPGLWWP
ncbi:MULTISPECIES: hypothetical protein [Methylococcus]|jgi:hypothetical protein|uniref:Lipoprotein n=1 Tax=Methylococcus capsulatus TaxID=414 RepID=A0AA35UJC4_METCP|nr:hypothetical protein [Methylococcus capsulatus]QXP91307.1 hypothetical protein KW114_03895 [Methylococcus capsulatus]CAI8854698.1 conserved protein of unknown function [Methylococcus capsulatus]